jgi:two-component sensor histidine kinase
MTSASGESARVSARTVVVCLILLLAGIGLAVFQSFDADRDARERATVTAEVLTRLRLSLVIGLDAETGQRGFLLTGDPAYLVPYERARSDWLPAIEATAGALGALHSPKQIAHVERMRTIATGKLAEMARTVELARGGRTEEALSVVREGTGLRLMEAFRAEVAALEAIETLLRDRALRQAARTEARLLPLLALLSLAIVALVMLGLRLERRAFAAEMEASGLEAQREARRRAELLSSELNHRVKNLFAIIMAIVSLSARHETDLRVVTTKIRDRIHGLARAHAISQGEPGRETGEIGALVRAILAPYGEGRVHVEGPALSLPVHAVTPLGLVLHELATNAAKYGALSSDEGRVALRWSLDGGDVAMEWCESGGPPVARPGTRGFGSTMSEQATRQLCGTLDLDWAPAGLCATLRFPAGDPTG